MISSINGIPRREIPSIQLLPWYCIHSRIPSIEELHTVPKISITLLHAYSWNFNSNFYFRDLIHHPQSRLQIRSYLNPRIFTPHPLIPEVSRSRPARPETSSFSLISGLLTQSLRSLTTVPFITLYIHKVTCTSALTPRALRSDGQHMHCRAPEAKQARHRSWWWQSLHLLTPALF
jgi:hypothetical protein